MLVNIYLDKGCVDNHERETRVSYTQQPEFQVCVNKYNRYPSLSLQSGPHSFFLRILATDGQNLLTLSGSSSVSSLSGVIIHQT